MYLILLSLRDTDAPSSVGENVPNVIMGRTAVVPGTWLPFVFMKHRKVSIATSYTETADEFLVYFKKVESVHWAVLSTQENIDKTRPIILATDDVKRMEIFCK